MRDAWNFGRRGNELGEIGLVHENLGAAVVEHELEFGMALARADGNDDCADAHAGEQDGEELPGISETKRDAVAGRDAERRQVCADNARQTVEIAIGDRRLFDDGRPVAEARDEPIEHREQRGGPLRVARHAAAVVMRLLAQRAGSVVLRSAHPRFFAFSRGISEAKGAVEMRSRKAGLQR